MHLHTCSSSRPHEFRPHGWQQQERPCSCASSRSDCVSSEHVRAPAHTADCQQPAAGAIVASSRAADVADGMPRRVLVQRSAHRVGPSVFRWSLDAAGNGKHLALQGICWFV